MKRLTRLTCNTDMGYREHKAKVTQRLKMGIGKIREALEQDAKKEATRKSGLPKDWRSRIIQGNQR